jgi:uncharacterized protein (DUF4415 family)
MSRLDKFKNKIEKEGKETVITRLVGNDTAGQSESAAASENQNKTNLNLDAIAAAFNNDETKEPAKKLKGIYLDEDILEVYEAQAKLKPRGWGSQMVNDLLRAVFEQQGLLPKK